MEDYSLEVNNDFIIINPLFQCTSVAVCKNTIQLHTVQVKEGDSKQANYRVNEESEQRWCKQSSESEK